MLGWLQKGEQDVYALIARKNYPKAIKVVEQQLRSNPRSVHLRQLLGDLWVQAGNRSKAIDILEQLADEFVAEGFIAKAIAVLKKIQRIEPARADIEQQLTRLLQPVDEEAAALGLDLVRPPVVDETPEPEAEEPEPEAPKRRIPEATSELRADWFDEAVDRRRDFHWSPLLADFSRDELAALIGGLRLLVKKPGAIIYGEDEPGNSMFILSTGRARVYRRDVHGRYQQAGMLQEGQFFGEASVLTESHRLSTITAAVECELLELDKRIFDQISETYPRVRETIQDLYQRRASFETASIEI
ncbi:MAG: cyclic nucleotide-binding domain-containing protein [Acidobacteriota bacterium]